MSTQSQDASDRCPTDGATRRVVRQQAIAMALWCPTAVLSWGTQRGCSDLEASLDGSHRTSSDIVL